MESILFSDGIFEFVLEEKSYSVGSENKNIKRKYVRRVPGVRAIIVNKNGEILLSKEYRYELANFDYRLPGGKVFDSLEDYKKSLDSNSLMDDVYKSVAREIKEEVGIVIKNPVLYTTSYAGSSIVWDLYYFVIKDYEVVSDGQDLDEDEIVDGFVFKNYNEVIKMCIDKDINEERTVGVLFRYIFDNYINK